MPFRLLMTEEARTILPHIPVQAHTRVHVTPWFWMWTCTVFSSFAMHQKKDASQCKSSGIGEDDYCYLEVLQGQCSCPIPCRIENHGRYNCGLFLLLPHSLTNSHETKVSSDWWDTEAVLNTCDSASSQSSLWGAIYCQAPTALSMPLELTRESSASAVERLAL